MSSDYRPLLPPYVPATPMLVAVSADGYQSIRTLPVWMAKDLIASNRAKPAIIEIQYPEYWPMTASVVYSDDVEAVVIKRPVDLTDRRPHANPYMPGYLAARIE